MIKRLLLIIFSLIIIFSTMSYAKEKETYTKNCFAFDTILNVTVYDYEGKNDVENCLNEMQEFVTKYEKIFSAKDKDSELYKLNHKQMKYEDVSNDLKIVLASASQINALTSSKFDVNIGALVNLWDVKNRKVLPAENEIINAKKDKSLIDLGAIAKGYTADKIKEFLVDNCIKSAIISFGGNVVCIGNKKGNDFNIGIDYPFEEEKLIDAVKVSDKAVVTSGVYQRYFKVKGDDRIYSHIIDPDTGYPVNNDLYSVTIIMDDSTLADALSTSCMLLGYKESCILLDKLKKDYKLDIKAIFVDNKCKEKKY